MSKSAMNEPINERRHLSLRRDDWADAEDDEWTDAINTGPRPVDPRFVNYALAHRPQAMRQSLLLFEQMGGHLGAPALRFLGRK